MAMLCLGYTQRVLAWVRPLPTGVPTEFSLFPGLGLFPDHLPPALAPCSHSTFHVHRCGCSGSEPQTGVPAPASIALPAPACQLLASFSLNGCGTSGTFLLHFTWLLHVLCTIKVPSNECLLCARLCLMLYTYYLLYYSPTKF